MPGRPAAGDRPDRRAAAGARDTLGGQLDDAVGDGTSLVIEVSSYQAAAVEGWSGWGAVTSLAPEHLSPVTTATR